MIYFQLLVTSLYIYIYIYIYFFALWPFNHTVCHNHNHMSLLGYPFPQFSSIFFQRLPPPAVGTQTRRVVVLLMATDGAERGRPLAAVGLLPGPARWHMSCPAADARVPRVSLRRPAGGG